MELISLITASALVVPTLVALALPLSLILVARRDAAKRRAFVPVFARRSMRPGEAPPRRSILRG